VTGGSATITAGVITARKSTTSSTVAAASTANPARSKSLRTARRFRGSMMISRAHGVRNSVGMVVGIATKASATISS